jgi:membrane protease YdiL (CAAX protease family)
MGTLGAWSALLAYVGLGISSWQKAVARLRRRIGDWIVLPLLLPFLLATDLNPAPLDLMRVVVYLALPTICLRARRSESKALDLGYVLAVLLIWVPIELGLFALFVDTVAPGSGVSKALAGIYLLPNTRAALVPGIDLPIDKLTAILLALVLFVVCYPLEGIGFSFRLSRRELRTALLGLAAFAVVGLPLGVWLGFLRYSPSMPKLLDVIMGAVGGYLLVALPEEILFRGIIQNLLARRVGNEWVALVVAAVVFGLAHLNNATRGYPVPNWAYVAMATLAGLAYGWVWQRTKKVTASAVTHMLVNLVWGIVFQ